MCRGKYYCAERRNGELLVSNLAELTLSSKNMDYYKNLGYELPYVFSKKKNKFVVPRNSKIVVNIKDLTSNSRAIIQVVCDKCCEVVNFKYDAYINPRKNTFDGINYNYICRECEIKEIWGRVEQKCKDKGLQLLSIINQYENNKTKLQYICLKHKDEGIKNVSVNDLLDNNNGCMICGLESSKEKQKHSFSFIKEEFEKRDYDLLEDSYVNAKQSLKYICRKHPNEIQQITYDKLGCAGHGCKYCGYEKCSEHLRLDLNYVAQLFKDKNLELLNLNDYKNNMTEMKYICPIHRDKGIQTITVASLQIAMFGCNYCARDYNSGENNFNWKGGISPLHNYLRGMINEWKFDSMKKCNFKCDLTNKKFDVVHHLYSFKNILLETLQALNLPLLDQINKYNDIELLSIKNKFIELHYKRGLGVCLCKSVHDLFHNLYLRGDNTLEQYEEFKQRYYNFEFDELLSDEYKYKNVLLKEVG